MTWLNWLLSDANHIVAAATFVLACAAVGQFELMRRTAQRQLRAYIFPDNASLVDGSGVIPPPQVDRTDQPGIGVVIKNTGQTPGKNVLHWAQMDVATIDREWAMKPPEKLDQISPSSIPPQGINTKALWLNRPLSAQEKAGIQNGTYAVYLYGRIEYVDAFKRKRWGNYRLKYTGSSWPPYGNSAGMTFCDNGNDFN